MPEVYPGIFMNTIPLPNNPLRSINNYLVVSKGQALMIDTAFNREVCINKMKEIVEDHNLDLSKLRLFLTHLHTDHTGLASEFAKRGTEIICSDIDGKYIKEMAKEDSKHWKGIEERAVKDGLAEDNLSIENHPGFRFRPSSSLEYSPSKDGDTIDVGDFHFRVVDLKGHTPGLQGLYEPNHKILFCGDHILGKITPNITYWGPDFGDALGIYFSYLRKVYPMDIKHLYSSHRYLIDDHQMRIRELFDHHNRRLKELMKALIDRGEMTVRQACKNMHWDIRARSWEDFPDSQKWFAAGEAHAHLEHLKALGLVEEELRSGVLYYRAKVDRLPQMPLAGLFS